VISYKKYAGLTLILIWVFLIGIGGVTIFVDPLFHYHKPVEKLSYSLRAGQRYINDGITVN